MSGLTGYVHSVESCGTVDGPGIRFVIFLQGCRLRCLYCHNPDTWDIEAGEEAGVNSLMNEIVKYRSYMKHSGGGVTVSGGDPLMQPLFVSALFSKCRESGIHTALDTCGSAEITPDVRRLLSYTNLVLLDIKSIIPDKFKDITGSEIENTLTFAKYLSNMSIPAWIRHVLVPGLTDGVTELKKLAEYITTLTNIQKVEIIPFHKMGEYKWDQLGIINKLEDTRPATDEDVERANGIFRSMGVDI